ncbi:competence protein ComK [Calidifontibacillus erzurumensis]|uniref:competence protein ComK n=1 Tax=Calidifontibacillus erzurumensis TaxID=2741433 RepID=UPI0035B5647A
MIKVFDHYEVNKSTMAILSVAHIDYSTLILEENQQIYVRKTPTQIIKEACIEGGSTYDGRRIAVMHAIGARQKVPIPIDQIDQIFAFPTQSPKSFECSWIFYHHVKYISTRKSTEHQVAQSIITFKNGQEIILDESRFILEKQMQRTALCILKFSKVPLI